MHGAMLDVARLNFERPRRRVSHAFPVVAQEREMVLKQARTQRDAATRQN